MTVRLAVIQRSDRVTPEHVGAYLYSNYAVLTTTTDQIYIQGTDVAGFTLDAIIDRLASGAVYAREIGELK